MWTTLAAVVLAAAWALWLKHRGQPDSALRIWLGASALLAACLDWLASLGT